ncbi:hypothetical protein ANCCAN_13909 [Ancylostoma caninum]|uniref:Uncharacterized protein n=1 Tax=Ancylostoma caninum TaxID=29170 RepID=A0A368G8V1_ANCCA|nr:hypothetical protein ANCCAN_13909 [Ancylostoma caninum]
MRSAHVLLDADTIYVTIIARNTGKSAQKRRNGSARMEAEGKLENEEKDKNEDKKDGETAKETENTTPKD